MKTMSKKGKLRIIICFFACVSLFLYSGFLFYNYLSKINSNKKEISKLNEVYTKLLLNEEDYKEEIGKLEDPDYVAKYAREKYLYSKDGEKILRIIK